MHHSSPDLAVCFHAVGMILLMFVMAYIYHQSCPSAKAVNSLCAAVTGLGMVTKLGPKTGSRVKEGQRVVAVPWPTAGGEGTYQQYVATPEKTLVKIQVCTWPEHQSPLPSTVSAVAGGGAK